MSTSFKHPFGAVLLCLALAACGSPVGAEATPNAPVLGIDLGGAPAASAAMTGMDHSGHPAKSRHVQAAHAGHRQAQGTGTVNSVDAAARTVNVSHGPIAALGWPAITMDFPVAAGVDLRTLKPGTRINFRIEHSEGDRYVIQSLTPLHGGGH